MLPGGGRPSNSEQPDEPRLHPPESASGSPPLLPRARRGSPSSPLRIPFFQYTTRYYNHLITGSLAGVLINEPHPGIYNFLSYLSRYISNYGLRFTLADGVKIVKFLYLVMIKPGQYRETIYLAAKLVETLVG